jgi:hypothetical protein
MLGGISVTARRLGIAPKTLDLMLAQDVGSWKAGHVQRLAALTGIPMATLMMSHREDQR